MKKNISLTFLKRTPKIKPAPKPKEPPGKRKGKGNRYA